VLVLSTAAGLAGAQPDRSPRDVLIERGKALEIDSSYVAPPESSQELHAAGYAKIMCSAVFITGLDPVFAAENVGYFTAPRPERARLGTPEIDRVNRTVHVHLPNGTRRSAKVFGDQGCVVLPVGRDAPRFTPINVRLARPANPTGQGEPGGDILSSAKLPGSIDRQAIERVLQAAFEPAEAMTAALVVTWKGRIIAERYGSGINAQTPLESWSMGKSITAALLGVLIRQGAYRLDQPAPIPEWRRAADGRAKIRIADLLQMSSGLRIRAPQDPDYDPARGYPDHVYLYTGPIDTFHYAATRPQQWPPGTVGRYRNVDPVLVNYLVQLAVGRSGGQYLSFPQRALFDKLGIRTMVLETDAYGNFLAHGYVLGAARDWARLGNLFLQDGVCNGERLLAEGFVDFVRTPAPAWVADGRPIYGGFFWLNTTGALPVPRDAYYMAGSGTQITLIVPSHDLVVVRMGHYRGGVEGMAALRKALPLLIEAVPKGDAPVGAVR
jgi:CubicO group peptidase (beta-lactamase class C family)